MYSQVNGLRERVYYVFNKITTDELNVKLLLLALLPYLVTGLFSI